jgi:N-acetylmuramoyl-L-alanine amidase
MSASMRYIATLQSTMPMRTIDSIIVHCSATEEGKDFSADDIRRWHVDGNGWRDIGYHFVVRLDGQIEIGRPLDQAGAHVKGHNKNSIGVCYVGGLDGNRNPCDTRTQEQDESLEVLLATLARIFPGVTLSGHNEFSSKACPCFNVKSEYGHLV